jgi:hypothetical protein
MGKFERRNAVVEALQHDGTDESALRLEAWVLSGGGDAVAYLKGSVDFAQENAFLRVNSTRAQVFVGPGAWVVKVADKTYYPVSREDFGILYKPAMPPEPEDTPKVVRVLYRSTTPEGTWTESSSEQEVLDNTEGESGAKYWKLVTYETSSGWQEYNPFPETPLTDSAMAEMEATDE